MFSVFLKHALFSFGPSVRACVRACVQAVRESSHSEAHHHKQRQRSKDAAEHRQQLADKEQETIKLKHDLGVATKEIQTLKASLQEARNKVGMVMSANDDFKMTDYRRVARREALALVCTYRCSA